MPTLNADIPRQYCLVRKPFLYNGDERMEGYVPACWFGISSLQGRALGCHVLLENGAAIWRLPLHALYSREGAQNAPIVPLDWLQLWDCFSYEVSVTEFEHLAGLRMGVYLKDRKRYGGDYLFTVDWHGSADAEDAGDGGHKCGHVIKLDNGQYAMQPNNRVVFSEPATVRAFTQPPDYRTNTRTWKVEQGSKWITENSDRMFYGVEELAQTGTTVAEVDEEEPTENPFVWPDHLAGPPPDYWPRETKDLYLKKVLAAHDQAEKAMSRMGERGELEWWRAATQTSPQKPIGVVVVAEDQTFGSGPHDLPANKYPKQIRELFAAARERLAAIHWEVCKCWVEEPTGQDPNHVSLILKASPHLSSDAPVVHCEKRYHLGTVPMSVESQQEFVRQWLDPVLQADAMRKGE